jgi:hypothetical protein
MSEELVGQCQVLIFSAMALAILILVWDSLTQL